MVQAMNAWFFSLDPDKHWPNFAKLVTSDEHDDASDLDRPSVFRLNLGVGRTTFERLVGAMDAPDHAAYDQVLPHPVYAKQLWISILNPSHETFTDTIVPLLALAHDRLASTQAHRRCHPRR